MESGFCNLNCVVVFFDNGIVGEKKWGLKKYMKNKGCGLSRKVL